LAHLVELFSIEVIAYAVMSNHLHCLIRTRPDVAQSWTAEEVATRWRTLFPLTWNLKAKTGGKQGPTKEEVEAIAGNPARVELYRARLSSISWFNRCLNENIARRANKEDDCTGRFWEGRFQCQRVYDVAGIVACSAYIDLNPIRAGIAKTLEGSDHTSIQARIHDKVKKVPVRCKKWSSIPLLSIPAVTNQQLTLDDYLKLVDETGRCHAGKKKSISPEVAPILTRLNIEPEQWTEATKQLRKTFKRVVGPEESIKKAAKRVKRSWFHGLRAARKLFDLGAGAAGS